ncbi:MAG: hypothetical protein K2X43_23030 [Hyphomonadaceae bacterium]|jgi:hypothetical protein|nr:hypothetical protein [Hyphomonadaceae bacterium]
MTSRSIEDYRRRNEDAPLDLVRESATWKPLIRLIDAWAREKLGTTSGYTPQELDHISQTHGIRFPILLREWWRLAGRHPFVETGLLCGNTMFLKPHDEMLVSHPDFLAITVDDVQTRTCNGIHRDFLAEADPQVHGINDTIGPADAPGLNWYKGQFIATGLRIPALLTTTLLHHLCEPSPLVVDEAIYLTVERRGLRGGEPDERLVSTLKLNRFPHETSVGDIYSDGEDIIYWWLSGCTCRTAEAAERVRRTVPAQIRRRANRTAH